MLLSPRKEFPNSGNYPFVVTSPIDPNYNCIAWAYERDDIRMWPNIYGFYWPSQIRNEATIDAFEELFISIGYEICNDDSFEFGYLKIVIYALNGLPKHAARQLPNGQWTSKLGPMQDVMHSLDGMNGGVYGNPVKFMRRLIASI
jgi:hypothetical protein